VFIWLLHMFHIYVASVLSRCCICFARAFQVFFASVLDVCFKCFICLQKYVANVYLDISKVDRVLHMLQWRHWLAGSGLPQGFGSYLAWHALSSPLPLLPSLPSISPWQFELGGETLPDEHTDARGDASPGGPLTAWCPRDGPEQTRGTCRCMQETSKASKHGRSSGRPGASNARNIIIHIHTVCVK
jgi:hypothetical protein